MNDRTLLLNYLGWLANRHNSILHNPAARDGRRFFLWGTQLNVLLGNYALNNTGWNVLVDLLEGKNIDNRHDYEAHQHTVALHFVTKCDPTDAETQKKALSDAYDLGWSWLHKMKQEQGNTCTIDPNVWPPDVVYWESIRFQELSPLLFAGDHFYGYRFEVLVKTHTDMAYQDVDRSLTGPLAEWRLDFVADATTGDRLTLQVGSHSFTYDLYPAGDAAALCQQVMAYLAANQWLGLHFNYATPSDTRVVLTAKRTGDPYNLKPTESSLPAAITATVIANGQAAWNY
ncbi:MAG: hypothetical protein JNL05_00460 [Flavobacteriales bacterium]|nr:hypothetical protein [Flavobacteriales bacterium]